MSILIPFPEYTKRSNPLITVGALRISHVVPAANGGATLGFEDQRFVPIPVGEPWMFVHDPKPGGYFVVSSFGVRAFMASDSFHNCYSPVETPAVKISNELYPDSEFPSPPELSIVWHADPEAIVRSHWAEVAEAEGISIEELLCCDMSGQTGDGEEVDFSHADMIAGIREQGCWAYVDHNTNTVHAWARPDCNPAFLLHMLAHECGHATGKHHPDELQEEFRAEQFGAVAAMAYRFMSEMPKPIIGGEVQS